MVGESVAFLYEPQGEWVKGEDAPLLSGAPGPIAGVVEAHRRPRAPGAGRRGDRGSVLRFGSFYGPRDEHGPGPGEAVECAEALFPIVGKGTGVFSFIHVEDAAAATVAAVEARAPGVFNIVDDEPARSASGPPSTRRRSGRRRRAASRSGWRS